MLSSREPPKTPVSWRAFRPLATFYVLPVGLRRDVQKPHALQKC